MELEEYRTIWKSKKVLRFIYQDFYDSIDNHCISGNVLEIGGGIGNFDIGGRDVVRTDIQYSDSVSVVADAQSLPFSESSFNNIVLVDVLHHLECPLRFLDEASRVLPPGGRVVMVEPGITLVSWILYKIGHDELVDLSWEPKVECIPNPEKDPYESNQAIPTLLFGKYSSIVKKTNFSIVDKKWMSLFAYPLSGGFQKWSLVSINLVSWLLKLEKKLIPFIGFLTAFRLIIVLENTKKTKL
jgi:SAM-dependent methyltransferase